MLIDMFHGDGLDRRHGDARRQFPFGCVRRPFRLPEFGFREIVPENVWIENDLGYHPVGPLSLEQTLDLRDCCFGIVMGLADGDESGIPVPLMGVKGRRRSGVRAGPVSSQDLPGFSRVLVEYSGHNLTNPFTRPR